MSRPKKHAGSQNYSLTTAITMAAHDYATSSQHFMLWLVPGVTGVLTATDVKEHSQMISMKFIVRHPGDQTTVAHRWHMS
jgi:hypothetical protein